MRNPNFNTFTAIAVAALSAVQIGCDSGGAHREVVFTAPKPLATEGTGSCVPFERVLKTVFEPRCQTCHGEGSPNKSWLSYETASQFSGRILDKTESATPKMGGQPMPLGGSLSDSERALIKAWVEGGAKKSCDTVAKTPVSQVPGEHPSPPVPEQPVPVSRTPVEQPTAASACVGCHGTNGGGMSPDFPNLAGLSISYLAKQLNDFRANTRQNSLMNGFAQTMTDADIAAVADFFNSLPTVYPEPGGATQNRPVEASTCIGCHGESGIVDSRLMPNVPSLAGQKANYLIKQLKAFKSETRKDPTMSAMTTQLSDAQIESLANYFSGLRDPNSKPQ